MLLIHYMALLKTIFNISENLSPTFNPKIILMVVASSLVLLKEVFHIQSWFLVHSCGYL